MSSAARAMKRRMARQGYAHSYADLSREERKERLFRNGITALDVKNAWDEGFRAGFNDRTEAVFKVLYAAVILQMHEDGKTRDEILSFLHSIDHRITYSMSADEDVDRAYQETGIDFAFSPSAPDETFVPASESEVPAV